MFGHHRHASETPFKWRFAGGPMMAPKWYLDPPTPHQPKTNCQSWTPSDKLSGSARDNAREADMRASSPGQHSSS